MTRRGFGIPSILGVLVLAGAATVFSGPAPTGTYTATMGSTTATTGTRARGSGFRRGRTSTGTTSGTQVSIAISSYSSQEELDQLAAAQNDPAGFLKILSSFSHGTVTIGSASFPINAAYSTGAGTSGNIIYVLSSHPLTSSHVSRGGRQATGTSGGYIRLTLGAAGSGSGVLYSSTQVVVATNGTMNVKAGGCTASTLSNVTLQ